MRLKNIFILLTLVSLCQSGFSQKNVSSSKQAKTAIDSLLDEVNSKFTIDGKPINPMIIHDFEGNTHDSPGIITSLDLQKANYSGRYYCESCEGTYVKFPKDEHKTVEDGFFSYKYLGKTANNIHVVETHKNTGGRWTWGHYLFLSVHIRIAYEGREKVQQLILNLEGYTHSHSSVSTNDPRSNSKITIQQNKVIVNHTSVEPGMGGQEDKVTKERKEYSFE